MSVQIIPTGALDEPQRAAVRELAAEVELRDGQPPLSDQALTLLGAGEPLHLRACDADSGELLGYAQVDGDSLEVVGGTSEVVWRLVESVTQQTSGTLYAWSHGTQSAVAPALEIAGFAKQRVLHQLRRPLLSPITAAPTPAGVLIREFVPDQDEQAWLAVNAAAFAHHPEQGRWTLADVRAREAEPWFDPAGLLLAERAGQVIGFHWTKVHPPIATAQEDDGIGGLPTAPAPVAGVGPGAAATSEAAPAVGPGEVYVLGVHPSAQGIGLGAVLLERGLAYLAGRGCESVLLYVDDDNTTALRLYERAGFTGYDVDIQWRLR